jgi:hypothetical protein
MDQKCLVRLRGGCGPKVVDREYRQHARCFIVKHLAPDADLDADHDAGPVQMPRIHWKGSAPELFTGKSADRGGASSGAEKSFRTEPSDVADLFGGRCVEK